MVGGCKAGSVWINRWIDRQLGLGGVRRRGEERRSRDAERREAERRETERQKKRRRQRQEADKRQKSESPSRVKRIGGCGAWGEGSEDDANRRVGGKTEGKSEGQDQRQSYHACSVFRERSICLGFQYNIVVLSAIAASYDELVGSRPRTGPLGWGGVHLYTIDHWTVGPWEDGLVTRKRMTVMVTVLDSTLVIVGSPVLAVQAKLSERVIER